MTRPVCYADMQTMRYGRLITACGQYITGRDFTWCFGHAITCVACLRTELVRAGIVAHRLGTAQD